MGGQKNFSNLTDRRVGMTLYRRVGDLSFLSVPSERYILDAGQSSNLQYGDDANPYLNGICLLSIGDDVKAEQEFVLSRGSDLDNQLNMNSKVVIRDADGGTFRLEFSN